MKHSTHWLRRILAVLLLSSIFAACSAPAFASTVTVPINSTEDPEYAPPVINPALIGQWHYEDMYGAEIIFRFNEDGTGLYYANGMDMPIISYVATQEPFTQYEEDGFLITIYFGEAILEYDDETMTLTLPPMEYGYQIMGNTLRITFSRDIANHYIDLIREPVSD